MPPLGRPVQRAHPRHLQLKVLVLVVVVDDMYDPGRLLDRVLERQSSSAQIQLLQLGFRRLPALSCGSTVVALGG
jgi:hypothetical protein